MQTVASMMHSFSAKPANESIQVELWNCGIAVHSVLRSLERPRKTWQMAVLYEYTTARRSVGPRYTYTV